jgi:iron complex transport system permease protein
MFIVSQTERYSTFTLMMVLSIVSILSIIFSISFGSIPFTPLQLFQTFFSSQQTVQHSILFDLRIPRTLCAFTTGGLLALAGALMQILLRNPLADPYVLGVSGGASVTMLIAILSGIAAYHLHWLAFMGSLFSMLLVMNLAKMRTNDSTVHLLLTGIVVAIGWGAVVSLIFTISPQQSLHSILFWLIGDLSDAKVSLWPVLTLGVGLSVGMILARLLNVLCRGHLASQTLGINTKRVHFILYVLSSLLTGCAVSTAGCISFIGLVVPHMLRLLGKADHRFLLPACVLLGGSLLTLADTIARSIATPLQLPVGVVTAIMGVPAFLFLLRRCAQ